jgi:hypothetical protein
MVEVEVVAGRNQTGLAAPLCPERLDVAFLSPSLKRSTPNLQSGSSGHGTGRYRRPRAAYAKVVW